MRSKKKKSKLEKIKEGSNYLRGPLDVEVTNDEDHFSKDAGIEISPINRMIETKDKGATATICL